MVDRSLDIRYRAIRGLAHPRCHSLVVAYTGPFPSHAQQRIRSRTTTRELSRFSVAVLVGCSARPQSRDGLLRGCPLHVHDGASLRPARPVVTLWANGVVSNLLGHNRI